VLQQKLLLPEPRSEDRFGGAVGISGDSIVVTALGDGDDNFLPGSASVFTRDRGEWSQRQKLFVKEELAEWDFFGVSVAIHGSTIIAGNSGADGQRGAAYVFTADDKLNWSQHSKLVAGDGLNDEHFATSVATNGSDVLVGTPGKTITGPSCGAVYYSNITVP
jgi:hypothetical protein